MPSSTRKWRKQQKEYNRRRRQATRRAEEARQKAAEAEAKRIENERMYKLQTAFGITAAQGFGRNIFSGILASSKGQAANNLTRWVRERRLREAPYLRHLKQQRDKLQKYEEHPEYYGSEALFAISKKDIELLEYILEHRETNLSQVDLQEDTAIETTLRMLQGVAIDLYIDKSLQEEYELIHHILYLLMEADSPIRAKTVALVWELPLEELQYLFDEYPILKEKTVEFQAEIPAYLEGAILEIEEIIDEIQNEEPEFVRNGENSGYYRRSVPRYLYVELTICRAAIENLPRFLESYNPESGEYTL